MIKQHNTSYAMKVNTVQYCKASAKLFTINSLLIGLIKEGEGAVWNERIKTLLHSKPISIPAQRPSQKALHFYDCSTALFVLSGQHFR